MKPKESSPGSQQPTTSPHPGPDKLRYISLLTSNTHVSHKYLSPSAFPTNIVNALFHVSTVCHAHLILLDFIIFIFISKNKSQSFSLCTFLQPGVTSSFTSQNIFCSILLSNTLQPMFFPLYEKPSLTAI